jgi:hypothetical protein
VVRGRDDSVYPHSSLCIADAAGTSQSDAFEENQQGKSKQPPKTDMLNVVPLIKTEQSVSYPQLSAQE